MAENMIKRRSFIRATAIAGGGLLVACKFESGGSSNQSTRLSSGNSNPNPVHDPNAEQWTPNAFIRISADNFVTIIVGAAEIGQGTMTSIPMIVAEELDADWSRVQWEQSEASAIPYGNPFWQTTAGAEIDGAGLQVTAASTTVRGYYTSQREAGATVRKMLLEAAADRLSVGIDSLRTENSFVIHDQSGSRLSYGELAEAAASIFVDPITAPPLKDPADFKLIGQSLKRLDATEKTNGALEYGFDFKLDGMKTVVVARPPVFGGALVDYEGSPVDMLINFDDSGVTVPGYLGAKRIPSGLAIMAENFWAAEQARRTINITWNTSLGENLSTADLPAEFDMRNTLPGVPMRVEGLATPPQLAQITADYHFPYIAHAPMEPLNVTIDHNPGISAEIWCGSQWPDMDRLIAATILGLTVEQVQYNNLLSGGGFGRRGNLTFDFIQEAAWVARAFGAGPIKVVWSREDDIKGGAYRPFTACKLSADIDIGSGKITSWTHRVASQTLLINPLGEVVWGKITGEVQETQGAEEMPYAIDNVLVDFHTIDKRVPVAWARSVANAANIFAVETFFDELSQKLDKDPIEHRLQLLANKPRHQAVLREVHKASNWGNTAAGVYQGVALFNSYNSVIAQVVEVSVDKDPDISPQANPYPVNAKQVRIHRIVSAVDCGTAVNPDLVEAQIESGIVFALSSALFGEITMENGVVKQSNFDNYPILRMYQTPEMKTVILPSSEHPGGVGELGVPCVAPALVNALHKVPDFIDTTGRIRDLPLSQYNLSFVRGETA